MRVFINTFGSRGDVQPFVALGKGLKAAGHEVMVCTSGNFETFITEHGLQYGYATDEIMKLMDTDIGREAMEDTVGLLGTAKTMMKMVKLAKPLNRQLMIDSWEAAKTFAPDLVIYHPKALAAISIAEKFGAAAYMVTLQPLMAPTAEFPPIGVPDLQLGGWYNRLSYKAIPLGYRSYTKDLNEIRQQMMGLTKFPKGTGVMKMADGSPIPIMHAFSPQIVPPPEDWADYVTVNGYWFLEQPDNWQPSPELAAFLDSGDLPVYVGFGSMSGRDPKRVADIVVAALQQAQVRGIIATGWGGLDAEALPDTILKIDQAPHDWLFPRVKGVVHHGGAGTTAASLRAGRPTLICPFFGDQPFWGKRVQQLDVGPKPIPQKKLSVDGLAAALRRLVGDEKMAEKAARLGEKIQAEDGVAQTVVMLEQKVGRQTIPA